MTHYLQLSEKVKAWTRHVLFDENAKQQINNIASLPIIYKHIAVMPDVHLGIGATVGSVIPTKNAVIPAAVGVDIGCGMIAMRTNLFAKDLPDNLYKLRLAIEQAIPVGFDKWTEATLPKLAISTWKQQLNQGYKQLIEKHPLIIAKKAKTHLNHVSQLGTLGGGNHFIELCLDEHQQLWLMLHSGSRGIGNAIGTYFIELAKLDMQDQLGQLPDRNLAYFTKGTKHFNDYFMAVNWAQTYARCNRDIMMQLLADTVAKFLDRPIQADLHVVNCHHNYVSEERHFGKQVYITRKGAVSAKKNELGIIPGSMGAKSFIVRGLGNEASFTSCSHGAGRVMSRHQAKKRISLSEHKTATQRVECRKDKHILDESPAAYKDIAAVMKSQEDLVEILFTLKQILCVKG
ncbi:replication factor C subunit (activator I) [Legionella beliardensis]|uniref:3'-phosphate/5'-hydroxy nucleic acid ligase n=1 Tax=Legionella beliardensis TaxID=91822 RepID=A0A378HZM8_9GAMM|nr:RtcB family protein [Legionella beliardensis]STX28193.1 replication factor C subunit (activator I) [Legionella beliardensis]